MRGVLRSLTVVVAGSGLVLGVAYLPAPLSLVRGTSHASATTPRVEPITQAQAICPGPEALGIAGLTDSLAQVVSVTAAAAPDSALPTGLAVGQNAGTLTMSGLPTGGTWAAPVTVRGQTTSATISTAQSALVAGDGAMAPGTVATQRSWVTSGDNRGLVTAACVPAAASSWLIAGGGDPGRRERLVLTNPGPNPVTVDLTVLGVNGPIQSPNGHGLVVGPRARTVVLLDAIAGSEPSPVIHVVVQGGEVAAVLSDAWLDGVISRGGDDTAPVAAPAREQVMAGVAIEGRATLRIAVPGDGEAVVEARVLTASGPKPLDANGVTRLAAHSTKDVDLSALPPDAYAVQVRADVPVVAAAMIDRRLAPGAASDLAWSGASAPITTLAGMALDRKALDGPGGTGLMGRLELAATYHPASVQVTTVDATGQASTKEVAIGADSVSSLALDGATSVWVTPLTGGVRAAVLTWVTAADGTLLSVTPLADLTLTSTSVRLRELRN
ncbi:MAG: hypothetical protein HHJ11_04820 [Phycicoccus sp.]|nr:hypothetical protein [Phycicoccus sp.]NMM32875.1 hypothetical protein [Phycicoccus sp.]